MSKLRIAHLSVTPVLVWDDGEELMPGPEVKPITIPLSQAAALIAGLPEDVAGIAARLAEGADAAV